VSSAADDSFMNGLLEYPQYTRPAEINGVSVPKVLLSGNHRNIMRWRRKQALGITKVKRPDLLEQLTLNEEDMQLLVEYISEQGS
jgi:tRNA (guanine37-N1)-methyltransferase